MGSIRPDRSKGDGIAVDLRGDGVRANEARLGQVFLNLLVNAAQAIPEGDVDANEVRVSLRRAGDDRVVVEVRDTGGGIAPEHRDRIFEPFFTTKDSSGTGLGLSIVPSGRAAVALLANERFDAMLLDLRMNDGAGADVVRWLGEHQPDAVSRVILMTGGSAEEILGAEPQLANWPVLSKPFELSALREALERALRAE